MAMRRVAEATLNVTGPTDSWLPRCKQALEATGFSQVKVTDVLHQVTGKYRTFTTVGEIEVSLAPNGENTTIHAKATANVDNIFVLFRSPTGTILSKFKQGLGAGR